MEGSRTHGLRLLRRRRGRDCREAIQSGCATATDIGIRLKAGTNGGSCFPEIKGLITRAGVVKKIA
jgi:NAD(P)H-nitrite reductase large subunit